MPYRKKTSPQHCSRCDIKPHAGRKIAAFGIIRLCEYCIGVVQSRMDEVVAEWEGEE